MPLFRYTVIDDEGNRQTKTAVAQSKAAVMNSLVEKHLFVVQVSELSSKSGRVAKSLTQNEKIDFTQNVSVLLSSGISLAEAMSIIADDSERLSTGNFYAGIQNDLERGSSFSKSLAKYPEIFDSVYVSLVEAGENSGRLDTIMNSLAKNLEKDNRLRNQVKSALLYPGFILASLVVLGSLIVFFVLPKITKVFAELEVTLPLATRLLVGLGDLVARYPFYVAGVLLAIGITLAVFVSSSVGKRFFRFLARKTPLIRDILKNLDLSRLSSTLSLLINAGVPIQEALRIGSGTVGNPILSSQLIAVSQKLAQGAGFAQTLQETLLPKTFVALVAVGERSGKIASIFDTLANHYDNQLDTSIKNFTGVFEPLMTLLVGLMVGAVVITIMLPIYSFVGNLEP